MKQNNHTVAVNILRILADGKFHSGEKLAKHFNLSRVAIHQQIQKFSLWGLTVFAVRGKGYSLSHPLFLYQYDAESSSLHQSSSADHPINLFPIIDSTNEYLLQNIPNLKQGEVCIAEYQYAARGRRGRRYFAPFGTNLYFSLHWQINAKKSTHGLSLVVGIVVAELLASLGVENIKLKWPNDIYLDNKKLGGILIESKVKQAEMHLVIGIGLNLYMREADAQIVTQDWISLHQKEYFLDKNSLVIALQKRLIEAIQEFEKTGFNGFIERWQLFDLLKEQSIQLSYEENQQQVIKTGLYEGVDQDGALLINQYNQDSSLPNSLLSKNISQDTNPSRQTKLHRYLVGDVSLRRLDD